MNRRHRITLAGIGDEAAPDLAGQLAALGELGWTAIELRTVDGVGLTELTAQAFARAAQRIFDAGMEVVALDSRIGDWAQSIGSPFAADLEALKKLAERAHALDCRFIRIMSYPNDGRECHDWRDEALTRIFCLTELARALDVVLLHENCAGWASQGADQSLAMLRAVGSEHLALLFDIGNARAAGQDVVAFLRQILPHVRHVHAKDTVLAADGTVQFTWPGSGEAQLAACLRQLTAFGYVGAISIEPHVAHLPHCGRTTEPELLRASFVEFGRRFTHLVQAALSGQGNP